MGKDGETAGSEEMKYRGVRQRESGKYIAKIRLQKYELWLGTYTSALDAARAYDTAAVKFRGPNAITNFPQVAANEVKTINEVKTEVNFPPVESVVLVPANFNQAESKIVLAKIVDQIKRRSLIRKNRGRKDEQAAGVREGSKEMKYRGVKKRPSGNYAAEINEPLRKNKRWLGTFTSALDAARAYDAAAIKIRGPNAITNFPQASVSEENTEVHPSSVEAGPTSVESIVLPFDDAQILLTNVNQPLREKTPPEDYQNAVEMDGAESCSQSHHKSMDSESEDGAHIPNMAPVEYCREVMRSNAYIPDNLRCVLVRLFDSHPETFSTTCLSMDSSLLAFCLQGVAAVVDEIINTDSSSLEMSIINGHLNSLNNMQKDGFNFSWLIKSLKNLRDPYMTICRAQYRKNMEDLKIEEGRLMELDPKIIESAHVVKAAEEALAQAKRTHENNLMEKATLKSSISAISYYQREISSDLGASIKEDFFTTHNLLFLLD